MLGRQVTAALRRPLHATLRTTAAPQYTLAIRTFSHAARLLDPAGRPRKAVGEPSRPVKRAVKAAAKEPASPDTDAAAKKVAEKKRASPVKLSPEQKLLAKEKLAAKKAAEKERLAKKNLAAKERVRATKEREKLKVQKKKDAAAAAKQAARSPEMLEKKKQALLKARTKPLMEAALEPPASTLTISGFTEFSKTKGKDLTALYRARASDSDPDQKKDKPDHLAIIAEHAKKTSAAYKALTPAEVEHYNHLAHTAKEAASAEYKRWVESHSPEEIWNANKARSSLRRIEARQKHQRSKWPRIVDERQPKTPATVYMLFNASRNASGDFKNIKLADRAVLVSQEWKALSEDEKSKYKNLADQERERYNLEKSAFLKSSPTPSHA